ncbi:integrase-like protein [Nitrosomonas sp. Nm84]|uniref:phage integrase N-terminal SAM-like domain-containing protein n=1 Tax=Nitrosomonas sp. Nm84 TaxID=200124 RepID=UPI000D764BF5|nr:integrase-like protein [Nitrosomonas sp. Nm84]
MIEHYIVFNGKRHPADRGAVEMERFWTYLANQHHVSSATQNQALSTSCFYILDILIYNSYTYTVIWLSKIFCVRSNG